MTRAPHSSLKPSESFQAPFGMGFRLSKYVVSTFAKWLTMIASIFFLIFALFDTIELLRKTSAIDGISFGLILKMVVYRVPWFFQDILPFIVFFASIVTFWSLNRSNEILILRSIGISIWRLLTPLIAVIFAFGIFDLLVINPFATKLMEKYNFLESHYIYKASNPFSISHSGLWLRESQDNYQTIINARTYNPKTNEFQNVSLFIFDDKDKFVKRIQGPKAILKNGHLLFPNGWHMEKNGFPQRFQDFSTPSMFTASKITNSFLDPDTLSFYSLTTYANLMEESGLSATPYKMQWHTLISKCLWLCVMVLLAATFSLGYRRNKKTSRLILSGVFLTFVLYLLKDITFALGSAGNLPPLLAAWVPVGVTAFLAMTKLLYAEDG